MRGKMKWTAVALLASLMTASAQTNVTWIGNHSDRISRLADNWNPAASGSGYDAKVGSVTNLTYKPEYLVGSTSYDSYTYTSALDANLALYAPTGERVLDILAGDYRNDSTYEVRHQNTGLGVLRFNTSGDRILTTSSGDFFFGGDWSISGGSVEGSAFNVTVNTATGGNVTFGNRLVVTNMTVLEKSGQGGLIIDSSSVKLYTDSVKLSAGFIDLDAAITEAGVKLVANGGELRASGLAHTFGVLDVNGSVLFNMDTAGVAGDLTFADSSAETWSGAALEIASSGFDNLIRFGTDANGLTSDQLDAITWNGISNLDGDATQDLALDSSGYLTVIPEPVTLGMLAMSGLAMMIRRYFMS